MGNGASSNKTGASSANGETTVTDGTAPKTPTKSMTSPTGTRRILKAVKPSPMTPVPLDLSETGDDNAADHDDNDGKKLHSSKKTRDLPLPIAESPSIARELELEKIEQQKQGRMQVMQSSQRAKREKRLEERRKKDINDTTATTSTVQANPFSRFLSVFSVEPAHPEHKRAYEVSDNDDPEPTGKKARSAEDELDVIGGDEDGFWTPTTTTTLWAASAVAVVAIVAGIWIRTKKST